MNTDKTHSPARVLRTPGQLFSSFANAAAFALAAAVAATAGPVVRAQNAPAAADADTVELEAYVVSASRTEQNIKLTPSSVTSLALSELSRIQIPDLRTALQMVPGVNISETGGAVGSKSAIFMRGAGSNQTLFLVDGIRMNAEDWTSGYTNFLGAASLAGLGRVEILRGPQSTLYGSAAMGGVVVLETAHGRSPASGSIAVDGGSFNSIGASASVAGRLPVATNLSSAPQTLGYSVALTAAYTENDRDFNMFRQYSGSTRIEYQLADRVTAGFTYRGLRSHYEEPGPTDDPSQAGLLDLNIDIATLYTAWKPVSTFDSRLTYGWVQNIYDWDSSWPSYAHSTRNIIDWQNTWQALDQLRVVAGINAEWSRYVSDSAPSSSERLASIYLNAVASPVRNLELTAGIRGDDYSTFDSHATWRVGAAYRVEQSKTTLRATYGTGFNAPAPQYVQGGGYYAPSPDLKPEKSKGWDVGVEQDIWHDRITFGMTYFRNDFEDKFAWDYNAYPIPTYNIPGATTKGIETCLYTRPIDGMNAQIAYTYLDTRDNNGARLVRMPRHILSSDINYQFTRELLAGIGFNWVGGRPGDTQWNPAPMPSYTTVRIYGSYEVIKNLKLKLRLENLLDKKYETVAGYPGLPLGVFGGVEWKF